MGASFAVFAAFYYWVEKIIGRRYDQLWGAVQFWTLFIGVKTFARTLFDAGKSQKRYFIRIAWPILKAIVTKRARCLNNTSQKGLFGTLLLLNLRLTAAIKVTHLMEKGNGERLSAGVCELSTAPQRINAKELAYLLGLIESEGSISCYLEKNKGKLYFRSELCVGLKEEDIKLCYWIRRLLGCGTVRKVNHSEVKERKVSRYQLRSKKRINETIIKAFIQYPPLTDKKAMQVEWFKRCYKENRLIHKTLPTGPTGTWGGREGLRKTEINIIALRKRSTEYIKDWIVGFIEGDGSFYITSKGIVGFNVVQKGEKEVMKLIRRSMGIRRKITEREGINTITAESKEDIQRVVDFMTERERVRLKGLKRVQFIKWLRYLRRDKSTRYGGIRIPNKY